GGRGAQEVLSDGECRAPQGACETRAGDGPGEPGGGAQRLPAGGDPPAGAVGEARPGPAPRAPPGRGRGAAAPVPPLTCRRPSRDVPSSQAPASHPRVAARRAATTARGGGRGAGTPPR